MITQQILETADRTPEKIAINFNDFDVSYHLFAVAIRSATRYFANRGFSGPGVAVIAAHELLAFWVWSLALRRLGLTIVSVSSSRELRELSLSNIAVVFKITGDEWPDLSAACADKGYILHEVDMHQEPHVTSDSAPPCQPGGQILKTSGTTGTLKKILIEPQSEDMYADERAGLLGLNEDTVCNIFRMSPWTGLGYKVPVNVWAKGGRIIINQQDEIHKSLLVPGATHAVLTPQILAEILAAPEDAFPRQERMILCVTGGTISHAQVAEARRRITPLLFNMLATTEIGIFGFTLFDKPADHRWHRQLPGSVVQVVDDNDLPVPAATVGRLRIANPAQARYFEEDEANQIFFRDGFFYPGDLAEMDNDGRIALQGRTTDVVNIRGSKISPFPLESLLSAEHDGRQFCIFSMQDRNGEERVFCVAEGAEPTDEPKLASIFDDQLGVANPVIRYVASMPRTESGKVIRQQLREGLMG